MEKLRELRKSLEEKSLEFWTSLESGNIEIKHLVVLTLTLLITVPSFAASTDPWGNFTDLIITWIQGNLGKLLAILTVMIGAIIALTTHSVKPLAWSIVIAIFVGGIVGIARMFFEAGQGAFGSW